MSIRWMTRVWDESPYTKDLLLAHLAMADFANDEGHFWAKQTTIAAKARVSTRYVKMIVARMKQDGYLRVVKKGRRNTYYLTWPSAIGEDSSPVIGESHDTDRGTGVPLHIEPSVEPSEEKNRHLRSTAPPARGGDHMPDPRLEGRSVYDEEPPKKKTKNKTPPEGTHAWAKVQFHNLVLHYGKTEDYSRGHLDNMLKDLRSKGYNNDQIVRGMEKWAITEQDTIRTASVDPVRLFHTAVNNGLLRSIPKEKPKRGTYQITANERLGLT